MNSLHSLSILLYCCFSGNTHAADTLQLTHYTWKLQRQVYTSHNTSGTDTHKVKGRAEDYIRFEQNGKAIVHYQGNCDTLSYTLDQNGLLYIGEETPYQITITGNKEISLLQKTDEADGNYSSVTLELKR